jgi:hypothetical protein
MDGDNVATPGVGEVRISHDAAHCRLFVHGLARAPGAEGCAGLRSHGGHDAKLVVGGLAVS